MRFTPPRIATLTICWATLLTPAVAEPPNSGSLDEQLLEGLNEGLDEIPAPAARPSQKPVAPAVAPSTDAPTELDDELLKALRQEQAPDDPLIRIGNKMQRASDLISQRTPIGQAQSLQQEILSELDRLLEQARKQAQKQQSAQRSEQASRRDQAAQPGPNQSAQGNPDQNSQNPARDSESQLRSQATETPDLTTTRHLMQELWGHLPDRDRQRVINSTVETFIPKYEFLIKEYFKRLAESAREHSP
jgi:hypothetical protein